MLCCCKFAELMMKRAREEVVAEEGDGEEDNGDEDDDVEDMRDVATLTKCLADILGSGDKTSVCSGDTARELPLPVLMVGGTPVALPLRPKGPSADLVGGACS